VGSHRYVTSDAYEHSLVRYQATVLEILHRYREPEPWWQDAARWWRRVPERLDKGDRRLSLGLLK
jgi:hypothetical protein